MKVYGKFDTLDEVYAVIVGNIKRNYPTIKRSIFNKIITEMGLEPCSKEDFKLIIERIKGSTHLSDVYGDGVGGLYSLSDITVYNKVEDTDLFNIVTPYTIDKLITQKQTRDFNKAQREGSAQAYLSQEIAKNITRELKEEYLNSTIKNNGIYKRATHDDKNNFVAVLTPSDWHLGAQFSNIDGNSYNIDIAKERLDQYVEQVDKYLDLYKPRTAVLINLGDFINHAYMHSVSQAFETDLDATQQLSKAIRFFVSMINHVAQKVDTLIVGAVGGNHDRFSGNKKEAIFNDNVAYNVVDTLLLLSQLYAFPKNVVIKNNLDDVYNLEVEVAGKRLLFVHGDHETRNDNAKIPTHIKEYPYDALFMGHYHYNKSIQEDYARMSYMSGSLLGANSYSKTIQAPRTAASQLLTMLEEGSKTNISIPIFFSI